mgnify:CR=1 FL=1
MKKLFLIFVAAIVLSSVAWADDDDTPDDSILSYYDFSGAGVQVFISPDWILFDGEKLPRSEFRLANDGYYYIKDNIVIFDQFHHLLSWHNATLNFHPLFDKKVGYGTEGSYTPSSFFTETLGGRKIAYDAQDLNDIIRKPYINHREFYGSIKEQERFFIWNEEHEPWVTQRTGESVTAEFADEVNAVALLNGYADPYHPDYYKKNARVKDIKITDENGAEYFFTLDDEVRVQTFMLNNCAKKLTLTVLSVYGGEKYGDIALSMFSGIYADTYMDWIVFRELEAAKDWVEHKYELYEDTARDYPDQVPHGVSLIEQEWELYYMIVEDRITKEFGGKSAEHDVEIYSSPEFKIHLAAYHGRVHLVLYTKENIKAVSFRFKNFYSSRGEPIEIINSVPETEKKDGWIVSSVGFGGGELLSLPLSAWIQVEYASGKKREVTLSKDGLAKVRRFGELVLGAFDWK